VSGTLYVVATPIGNLEDITARALRILREVDVVACEDTRRTRALLTHFDIHVPTVSYYEHNKLTRGPQLLRQLADGRSIALVSDAGTPGISDPGVLLVREARTAGIRVVPVPGPSAVTAALSAAGLSVKSGRRVNRLKALRDLEMTIVVYESPHRIDAALEAIAEVFGDRPIVVARELTKQFEEIVTAPPAEHLERLRAGVARGEFTLVIPAADRRS